MTAAVDRIIEAVKSQAADNILIQRQALLMKYECDSLEQNQRSDSLRIYGMKDEREEDEEALEEEKWLSLLWVWVSIYEAMTSQWLIDWGSLETVNALPLWDSAEERRGMHFSVKIKNKK